jgi:hypothetical protein
LGTYRTESRVGSANFFIADADTIDLSLDQNALRGKYDELATAYREKSQKHKQALQLYEALKKKYLVRDAQTAASANVNHTLQSIGTRPSNYQEQPTLDPLQVYNEGINLHKARSNHSQVGHADAVTRFDRPLSEINDPREVSNGMPPPARPCLAYNIRELLRYLNTILTNTRQRMLVAPIPQFIAQLLPRQHAWLQTALTSR